MFGISEKEMNEHTGWAWQTRATSSADAPYSIAKAASLTSSPAP